MMLCTLHNRIFRNRIQNERARILTLLSMLFVYYYYYYICDARMLAEEELLRL